MMETKELLGGISLITVGDVLQFSWQAYERDMIKHTYNVGRALAS